jgi:two-component system C4-dicarboxylate transport sensor histidine kinase DctB
LKGFSRKSVARPEAVDPAHALARALFLFQWRLDNERVTVDNRCLPGAWTVWCDANRLQQVLVNLVSNALDAMRDAPDKRLTLYALGDAQQGIVSVYVQDNGKGLSDDDLAHMFQPFYTTKSHGAGLGLGLVICRDIAAEFGGDLQASHAPGGGACFVLRIPMHPPVTESLPPP